MRPSLLLIAALAIRCMQPSIVEPPAPYVPPPLPTGDPCSAMCEHLDEVGCTQLVNCADVCRHVLDARLMPLDLRCALDTGDRASALRCAGVGCQP